MSRVDRITSASKKSSYYADFLINLDRNPVSGELARVQNERSVIRAIRNLIRTNRGERLFASNVGCNIKRVLFEPADDTSKKLLTSAIVTTIEQHEPRVTLKGVSAVFNDEQDSYTVNVTLALVNTPSDLFSFSTVLKRVR